MLGGLKGAEADHFVIECQPRPTEGGKVQSDGLALERAAPIR